MLTTAYCISGFTLNTQNMSDIVNIIQFLGWKNMDIYCLKHNENSNLIIEAVKTFSTKGIQVSPIFQTNFSLKVGHYNLLFCESKQECDLLPSILRNQKPFTTLVVSLNSFFNVESLNKTLTQAGFLSYNSFTKTLSQIIYHRQRIITNNWIVDIQNNRYIYSRIMIYLKGILSKYFQ